jgi:hypothetical protein
VLTQLIGLFLIWLGLRLLKNMPDARWSFVILLLEIGGVITAVWWLYCWRDSVRNALFSSFEYVVNTLYGWGRLVVQHFVSSTDYNPSVGLISVTRTASISPPLRKTGLFRAILALVIADNILLALLILVSGGPGHSSLEPLLPMIVIIAIILKQPTRTVGWSLGLELLVIVITGLHWGLHALNIIHPDIPEEWIYVADKDPRFTLAFAAVACFSVGLSFGEYYILHLRPRLGRGVSTLVKQLNGLIPDPKRMTKSVHKGTRLWIKWLTHRGLSAVDLSLVHDEGNVVKQALILSIPYWTSENHLSLRQKKRITRHITFLTFAAHWIDDHFDALNTYCKNTELQQKVLSSAPSHIMNEIQPRLAELLKRMKKLVDSKYQLQIERAVVRIIYGGLIQNAPNEARLNELLKEYAEYVSKGLSDILKQTYSGIFSEKPLSIWVTSKVVIELLDSCSPTFSLDVSEFYNLLYGPILYYQDRQEEIKLENFGAAFGPAPKDIDDKLPTDEDMISLVQICRNLAPAIPGTDPLPIGRRTQLRILRDMYKNNLPEELFKSYEDFLAVEDKVIAAH